MVLLFVFRSRRRRRQQPQPPTQQAPPAHLPGGEGDDLLAGLKARLPALMMAVIFQFANFVLIIPAVRYLPVCPLDWEHQLRLIAIVFLSIVVYVGVYFVVGKRLWGFLLRVLAVSYVMAAEAAVHRSGNNGELTWGVPLSNIVFMLFILLLP